MHRDALRGANNGAADVIGHAHAPGSELRQAIRLGVAHAVNRGEEIPIAEG
jgi:hypothetical protein